MQIISDNILTNYTILGGKNKKNILFLHGWGRNFKDWLNIAQNLSKKYKVILLDLPGFGGTKIPPENTFDTYDYANFVSSFIKKIRLTKTTLIGHSFGGKISIVLAAKYPEFFEKLILVSASGVEEKTLYVKLRNRLFKSLKLLPFPQKIKSTISNILGSRDYKSVGIMRNSFIKIINQDVSKEAKKIKTPTLIIWGEKDKEVPVKWGKKLNQLIKKSYLRIIWGAGHFPQIEKTEKFESVLHEYL